MAQVLGHKLSKISAKHYAELVFRSLLFLSAVFMYVTGWVRDPDQLFGDVRNIHPLLWVVWLVLIVEMILRFFPSSLESMGCQKQFPKNYMPRPDGPETVKLETGKSTLTTALAWFALNGVIGILYFIGIIDAGILLLISLAYSVCDMICILFFCPFQTWFQKNKCCTTCRIYNWDYAMMATPLVFVPTWYTWSLLACALALLIRWELAVRRHPEWFSEKTNCALSCSQCQEKLCTHKKQLRRFLKDNHQKFKHELKR
ncbi:MAG: hypothetical protein IKU62_03980 [Ruminiclostridium sp.]|nr:hypothetical protein [Ruminiclostridium sp.]